MQFNLTVTDEDSGKELRDIMRDRLQMSRTMIKKVKLYGTLEVNGEHSNRRQGLRSIRGRTGQAQYRSDDTDLIRG